MPKTVKILAIESSADETSAAVLVGDKKTRKFNLASNVVYSQIKIHQKTGGIVPEVAARNHILKILPVIRQALAKARVQLTDINAIAVTAGPGLITSLMIGVDSARALAFALQIPMIPVNHMEGHLLSALGGKTYNLKPITYPALGLIVSGGHTMLVLVKKIGDYKILGQTLDDAAGECFDKVAKILGLSYPGGPEVARLARQGNPKAIDFPRPMIGSKNYNFSFSGLKTAVLYYVRDHNLKPITYLPDRQAGNLKANIAASLEQAIVDVLVAKTIRAAKQFKVKSVLLGGGVAANHKLQKTLGSEIKKLLPKSYYLKPNSSLTTDNAGMIAVAAWYQYLAGRTADFSKIVANPNWELKSWQ